MFDPKVMAAARAAAHAEHGDSVYSMVRLGLAEYQVLSGTDAYRWDADAWYGGDIHRLVLKTEGEGEVRGPVEDAELQALYARATGPYFNFQAGVRADFEPTPSRVYATIGVEGLAPYYIETLGAVFLSHKGELLARLEASYDQLITNRLVIQPRAEMNLAATDIDARGIGKGVSNIELGLRLRYEIKREFAPYIGLSYHRKTGRTADLARAAGERVGGTAL
ncbi:MAG: copper resistance protein B, partial [Rhodospirillaceae bacterium]|nr:copper resistance protein B [Rhodospirillaceae bacterium]